ncbi:MAG: hypothetical protein IH592_05580 [Bacteroidales bacterium]|nr:hypothetical protein [Bacteroidales bacterium]
MGTIIKSIAFTRPIIGKGIVWLSSKAARHSLKKAGLLFDDIGIMINAGVYNESHLREPAVSALIQNQLETSGKRGKIVLRESGGAYSFDMHNGGGGGLNALQVIDGFIQSGKIDDGLVVAGDSTPKFGKSVNYNYLSGASAAVLSKGSGSGGFKNFKTETYPEYLSDFESTITWKSDKFYFNIDQKENYLQHCVQCAERSIYNFLEEEDLVLEKIDLILTSQSPPDFARELKRQPGMGKTLVLNGEKHFYSSGIFYALSKVFSNGKFKSARNILFVTVGAGITVTTALYLNEGYRQ